VSVASIAGLKGFAYVSAYVASKHAVVGLTRGLAQEIAKSGVTINAVCPGYVDTDLVAAGVARIAEKTGRPPDELRREFYKGNPQDRLIAPAEIASSGSSAKGQARSTARRSQSRAEKPDAAYDRCAARRRDQARRGTFASQGRSPPVAQAIHVRDADR